MARSFRLAHRIGAGAEVLARAGATLPGPLRDPRSELGPLHRSILADAALRTERVRKRVFPAVASAFPAIEVRFDLSRLEGLGGFDAGHVRTYYV